MTMIEVIFASVVLFGAIIIMLSMFETSIDMLQFTTSRSMATQIANEEVETIRSRDYEQIYGSNPTTWPDDADLNDDNPPKFIDISNDGTGTALRTLNTSTGPDGIVVERMIERKDMNFLIRNYVMWVDDGATANAFMRVVTKVSWERPNPEGEVKLVSNFSKENENEPRPSVEILGVVSSNYNYFAAATEDATLGVDDSVRGGTTSVYDDPVVYVSAKHNSALASQIDYVDITFYEPDGTEQFSTSASVDAQGRYYLAIDSTDYDDNKGYLIKAEAFDDLGGGDIDTLRVNIDNTPPGEPYDVNAVALGPNLSHVTWSWDENPGEAVPEINRFMIWRKYPSGQWTAWAALGADEREFLDTNPEEFRYRVWAVDGAGNFDNNNGDQAKIGSVASSDTISPGSVPSATVTAISWKTVELQWDQVTDDVGLAGYEWWATDGSNWRVVASPYDTSSTPATWQDAGLKPGKTYWYYIIAYDWAGNVSGQSPTYEVSTPMR